MKRQIDPGAYARMRPRSLAVKDERAAIEQRAATLERWHSEVVDDLAYRRRVDLPELERHALDVLARDKELIRGEKQIARGVLDRDIPDQEREIDAALFLLDHASEKARALYLVRPDDRRQMVLQVLRDGGVQDERGQWRFF